MKHIVYLNISTVGKTTRSFYMKNYKLSVMRMLIVALTFGFVLPGCTTEAPSGPSSGDEQVWIKEQFYSTEDKLWISQDDHSLMLVFTETQLKFRYDSNDDGDFEDEGEYTYTYTITGFGGNDWKGELGKPSIEGDYEREITVSLESKTGSVTNAALGDRTVFVVTPNLGGDGKIDGKIHISDDVNWDSGPGFFYKN
jgi:hypothetical protein